MHFYRGLPVMKIPCRKLPAQGRYPTMLFDLEKDPKQEHPIRDQEQEKLNGTVDEKTDGTE